MEAAAMLAVIGAVLGCALAAALWAIGTLVGASLIDATSFPALVVLGGITLPVVAGVFSVLEERRRS